MHGYGPSELVIYLREAKANEFVLGIFIAQDEERHRERMVHPLRVDLPDL